MSTDGPTITSLELEDRRFPPPPAFAAQANATAGALRARRRRPGGVLARPGHGAADLGDREPTEGVRPLEPALLHVVRRRHAERERQLPRPPPGDARRPGRLPLGGRARTSGWTSPTATCTSASAASPTGCAPAASARATASRSTSGMVPEIVVAMLACARIGAPHTVIFGGFSPDSVRDRVLDCGVTAMITGDGAWRGGKLVPLKANVNAALEGAPTSHTCVVVRRTENEIGWVEGRDVWYHELVAAQPAECEPEMVDAEHPLYILYTSGSHREAEGDPPHDRRLPHGGGGHPPLGVRPQGRRRLLVRGRRRLGHRPQLHRLRPARQRRDQRALRGRARTPPTRTAGGRSSPATG